MQRCIYLSLVLAVAGCSPAGRGFLDPKGLVAAEDRHLFVIVVLLMLIVVVPVIVLTPFFAWRYRRRNGQAVYRPNWDFSWTLEILIWGGPALIVAVLGVMLWTETHQLDPYRALSSDQAPLEVQVVGLDWKWLFIYPDDHIATVNELAIPENRPIHLSITSDTVMQSLMIPQLAGQIYAMAGMKTQLNLIARESGTFTGENTQYNGTGFHKQRFKTIALSARDFEDWLKQVRASGQALDDAAYRQLSLKSTMAQPLLFSSVDDGLFAGIVGKYHREGPAARPRTTGESHD